MKSTAYPLFLDPPCSGGASPVPRTRRGRHQSSDRRMTSGQRHRTCRQPTISLPEKNCAISLAAVSGASEPCTEFSPIDLAWTLRMVPGAALAGIGRAHDVAVLGDGVVAFEHLHHNRAGDHEIDQFAEKRPLLVHGVEGFGLLAADAHALLRDDPQAGLLDHGIDRAGEIAGGRIRLDDRKGTLDRHRRDPFGRGAEGANSAEVGGL